MADMDTDMSRERAAADLARAATATGRLREESRWAVRYFAVFAVGWAVLVLVLGLVFPLWLRMTIAGALWIPLVIGMVVWALRRRAAARGTGWRSAGAFGVTGVVYAVALFVGTPAQLGNAAYWVPAAVAVALPMVVAAVLEARR